MAPHNLRVKSHHLDYMRVRLMAFSKNEVDLNELSEIYKDAGVSATKFRFDVAFSAGLKSFIQKDLHTYLEDSHVDTALKHLLKHLNVPFGNKKGDRSLQYKRNCASHIIY